MSRYYLVEFVAAIYGKGVYFAKNSATSATDTYSQPGANGEKYVIQARVLLGEWTKGEAEMKSAPYKSDDSTAQYDSVVDDVDRPTIFVIFRDTAAYPEYVIKFK